MIVPPFLLPFQQDILQSDVPLPKVSGIPVSYIQLLVAQKLFISP
jgi:hypothetical protein